MAKITIYVPEELKQRMDQAEGMNWSQLACRAFEAGLATLAVPTQSRAGLQVGIAVELRRKSGDNTAIRYDTKDQKIAIDGGLAADEFGLIGSIIEPIRLFHSSCPGPERLP